jgi:hypothetical protein
MLLQAPSAAANQLAICHSILLLHVVHTRSIPLSKRMLARAAAGMAYRLHTLLHVLQQQAIVA